MPKAFLLSKIHSEDWEILDDRPSRVVQVLKALDFEVVILDEKLVDSKLVDSFATQYDVEDPAEAVFALRAREKLAAAKRGDCIVAIEQWHMGVFRGVTAVNFGCFRPGVPVVEMWVESIQSSARFCVFSSEACRNATAVRQNKKAWDEDWIVAPPFYTALKEPSAEIDIYVAEPSDGLRMIHLERMRRGLPVLAPDFGVWHETIEHGKTGILYRSQAGKLAAYEWVVKLPSDIVVKATIERFNLEAAVAPLRPYFQRICNA